MSGRQVLIMPLNSILRPTPMKRAAFFLLGDALALSVALFLAFYLRFGYEVPSEHLASFWLYLPAVVLVKIVLLASHKLYSVNWRYVGIRELAAITRCLILATAIIFGMNSAMRFLSTYYTLPRGVIVLDMILSMATVCAFRISKRLTINMFTGPHSGKPTLVIGAGRTGERLARELARSRSDGYQPVGFIDDDPSRCGLHIHGLRVIGGCDAIPSAVKAYKPTAAIITFPPSAHQRTREAYRLLADCGVEDIKVLPGLSQLGSDVLTVKNMHEIRIEDLLPRESVQIDESSIHRLLDGARVLVSGAGGSIGSEIVRRVLSFEPESVMAVEIDETELHSLAISFRDERLHVHLADIRNMETLGHVFESFQPTVVFHAAAYKHVPMMEQFPAEAIETNVAGTYNMASLSVAHGVREFVNISTDKAVNPTSIMGASKRIAEMVCGAHHKESETKFVSVRFGNVLGSRGSVLPVFLEQIKMGGPVTVTDPEMKRYFMSIPEAVLLVCQAAAMGEGGEVFVLDMGEPVKIVRIAEDLIRLHGLRPYDEIDIAFTGARPGEKLFEELLTAEEGTTATSNEKIFVARHTNGTDKAALDAILSDLTAARKSPDAVRSCLQKHVPFYNVAS